MLLQLYMDVFQDFFNIRSGMKIILVLGNMMKTYLQIIYQYLSCTPHVWFMKNVKSLRFQIKSLFQK